jgi:hypothetical protein
MCEYYITLDLEKNKIYVCNREEDDIFFQPDGIEVTSVAEAFELVNLLKEIDYEINKEIEIDYFLNIL